MAAVKVDPKVTPDHSEVLAEINKRLKGTQQTLEAIRVSLLPVKQEPPGPCCKCRAFRPMKEMDSSVGVCIQHPPDWVGVACVFPRVQSDWTCLEFGAIE